MKGLRSANLFQVLLILFISTLLVSPAFSQYKEKKFELKDCETKYKNCVDTKKIVDSVIGDVRSKKMTPLVKGEIEDAEMWLKKAVDTMDKVKEEMDSKKHCTYQMTVDLDHAWQWLVKAGSAAVRAQIAQKQAIGEKETWKK